VLKTVVLLNNSFHVQICCVVQQLILLVQHNSYSVVRPQGSTREQDTTTTGEGVPDYQV
jgi:hypothetical protein